MKQTIVFDQGLDADTLSFDYHGELEPYEVRALKASEGKFEVDFRGIPLGFDLLNKDKDKFASETMAFRAIFPPGEKYSLSRFFKFVHFNVKDLRPAYVLLRRMCHEVENTMILTLPCAPFFGLTQNFDFRVDVPREVMGFEAFKRTIIVSRR